MFSPFRDAGGAPKGLAEVTWDDLSQLADLDEGFVLEFKREYGPSVQRKVPKIIASFANSRGGWLVIGVDDDTHAVRPIERREADFSQIFGELCRRHVSPAPPFDVRFLPDPTDDARGVVLVRVDEGDFPPYIADGVVEIFNRRFQCLDKGFAKDEPVDVVIRPEDIDIVPMEQGQLVGTVTSVTFKGMQYDIIVDFRGFKWLIQTTDHSPVGARIGIKIDPDGIHIMKKSQYSGMFGDYSSFSEEYEEMSDANWEADEEESEDEK